MHGVHQEEEGKEMNDVLDVARAVGVWDANEHYQRQLIKVEQRRLHKLGNMLVGLCFGIVVATLIIWDQMIGVIA